MKLSFRPLTPARWPDLEKLFGARGACAGCWCMWWRLGRAQWDRNKGERNRKLFRKVVEQGVPGILAYDGKQPIGWCAIAPRETYAALAASRTLKPVDDQPVWSVTCFFVQRGYRRKGVSVALLQAAAEFARKKKAQIVEGYPQVARSGSLPDAFVWTGLPGTFLKAGFKEVARRSATRPIMRIELR